VSNVLTKLDASRRTEYSLQRNNLIMKPTIFRYGIYATLPIVALSAVHFFIIVPNVSWVNAEVAAT
jgi:hypothetical protein